MQQPVIQPNLSHSNHNSIYYSLHLSNPTEPAQKRALTKYGCQKSIPYHKNSIADDVSTETKPRHLITPKSRLVRKTKPDLEYCP